MKTVYHYTGIFFFWIIVLIAVLYIWDLWIKNSRIGDWFFVCKTLVTIFFRKDIECIERERHFIDTSYSAKAKKRWEHIAIMALYNKRLTFKN